MRFLAIALALALATAASAQQDPSAPKEPGTSKLAPKKGGKPPPPKPLTKTEQQQLDVQNAKARFMSAVGSCARPEQCDPKSPARNPELVKMVKEAEEAYLEACIQCASDKACEDERAKIRDGRGRFGSNVCVVASTKKAPDKGAKPPATTGKPAASPKPAPTSTGASTPSK
jgi:hypothetical protein